MSKSTRVIPASRRFRGTIGNATKNAGARSRRIRQQKAQKPLLVALYEALPGHVQGALIGFLIGAIPAVAGLFLLSGEWRTLMIIPPLVLAGMGYLIGMMLEPDRDLYM